MSEFNLNSAQRRRLSVLMERHLAALERFREVTERVSFVLLDMRLEMTPLEDRPPVSWEVEREEFIRRHGGGT